MTKETAKQRQSIINSIREFFDSRDYLETQTPILSPLVIPESTIPLFQTTLEPPPWDDNSHRQHLYLLPSPEYYLKQLLAQGWGNLYSLGPCFRNQESFSPRHNPEFTMLEYYTVDADYLDTLKLTGELLREIPLSSTVSDTKNLHKPIQTITMEEAFLELAGLKILPAVTPENTIEGNIEALESIRNIAKTTNIEVKDGETWEDIFHRIFLTYVEPNLPGDRPLALIDYPWRIRTTARRKAGTPWSERWELYFNGLELANVYTEEQDPIACEEYLKAEIQAIHDQDVHICHDPNYPGIAAALPPCSGAALGVDRLIMAATGHASIQEVRLFPLKNPRQTPYPWN